MAILKLFYTIPLVSFCSGVITFVGRRKHLLNTLLSLEFMMLSILFFLSMVMSVVGSNLYFILFFLTLAACEGALGLGLLVSVVRSHGNDSFNSFSILQC